MSVTESERNKLYNWFEENMGDANADALMRLLPPVGWADVATKRDLDALEQRIDMRLERIDARFELIDARFNATDARLDTLATKDELHAMRGDLQQTFVRWMFAAHGATVALLGLLIAATR